MSYTSIPPTQSSTDTEEGLGEMAVPPPQARTSSASLTRGADVKGSGYLSSLDQLWDAFLHCPYCRGGHGSVESDAILARLRNLSLDRLQPELHSIKCTCGGLPSSGGKPYSKPSIRWQVKEVSKTLQTKGNSKMAPPTVAKPLSQVNQEGQMEPLDSVSKKHRNRAVQTSPRLLLSSLEDQENISLQHHYYMRQQKKGESFTVSHSTPPSSYTRQQKKGESFTVSHSTPPSSYTRQQKKGESFTVSHSTPPSSYTTSQSNSSLNGSATDPSNSRLTNNVALEPLSLQEAFSNFKKDFITRSRMRQQLVKQQCTLKNGCSRQQGLSVPGSTRCRRSKRTDLPLHTASRPQKQPQSVRLTPGLSTVQGRPVEVPSQHRPVEVPSQHRPVEVPSQHRPVEVPSQHRPVEVPSQHRPVEVPSQHRPVEVPSQHRPVEVPSQHRPVEVPSQHRPVEVPSQHRPVEVPSQHRPVEVPSQHRPVEVPSQHRPVEAPLGPIWIPFPQRTAGKTLIREMKIKSRK